MHRGSKEAPSIQFWNGNKSPARQRYELDILRAAMGAATGREEGNRITEDRTDYPRAEDEGNIFAKGADILVTVGGNPKFAGKDKCVIRHPIAKGLLGKRLIIVKQQRLPEFRSIQTEAAMRERVIGIPATWADAALFRANGYPVVERGTFEEIFGRLRANEFDYVSLGAFEIEEAFEKLARPVGGLAMEPSLMLCYPMPLVFYVNPCRPDLARQLEAGIVTIAATGQLDSIFDRHFGDILARLSLAGRRTFHLFNPLLPEAYANQ